MKQFNLFSAVMLLSFFSYGQIVTLYDTLYNGDGVTFIVYKSEGLMKDGKKTGVWKTWDAKGQLSEVGEYVPYTDGMITFMDDTGFNFDTSREKILFKIFVVEKRNMENLL